MSEKNDFCQISFIAISCNIGNCASSGAWAQRDRKYPIRAGSKEVIILGSAMDNLIPDVRQLEKDYLKARHRYMDPKKMRLLECILTFRKSAREQVKHDLLRGDACAVNFAKFLQRRKLLGCNLLSASRVSLGSDLCYKFIFLANPHRDINVANLRSIQKGVVASMAAQIFHFASENNISATETLGDSGAYSTRELSESEKSLLCKTDSETPFDIKKSEAGPKHHPTPNASSIKAPKDYTYALPQFPQAPSIGHAVVEAEQITHHQNKNHDSSSRPQPNFEPLFNF